MALTGKYIVMSKNQMVTVYVARYVDKPKVLSFPYGDKQVSLLLSDYVMYLLDDDTPMFDKLDEGKLEKFGLRIFGSYTEDGIKKRINDKTLMKVGD